MKFIDLFAGLGGFHVALQRLGHTCVFASEIDERLRNVYQNNFGLMPQGNIRKLHVNSIPSHEILCAGFPCQPFSKAGDQRGLDCPKWGDLFGHARKILHHHKPRYFILENVPNLSRHDKGDTWHKMKVALEKEGYVVDSHRLSPHRFGIPQVRERVFIVGSRSGLKGFAWPTEKANVATSILSALQDDPPDARPLSEQVIECLEVWQKFIRRFPKKIGLPSFPIWSMEFGATYPFEDTTPHAIGLRSLRAYRGSHGQKLKELPPRCRLDALPSYARTRRAHFPQWKIRFIRQNRDLYKEHKSWIDCWIPEILRFPPSLQKLEWNCKGEVRDIWRHVIQFRASGVRVKRPTSSPSLVAMTTTQVPIIAWKRRYMTPRECANLQGLGELRYLPASSTHAFKALGNAVNADVVELVARSLLPQIDTPRRVAKIPALHRADSQRSFAEGTLRQRVLSRHAPREALASAVPRSHR